MFNVDFDKCRVIDVSKGLVPGKEKRRLRIKRKLVSIDDTFMHEIDTMSHIETHVEVPFNPFWGSAGPVRYSSHSKSFCPVSGVHSNPMMEPM